MPTYRHFYVTVHLVTHIIITIYVTSGIKMAAVALYNFEAELSFFKALNLQSNLMITGKNWAIDSYKYVITHCYY